MQIDSYDSPDAQQLLRAGEQRLVRLHGRNLVRLRGRKRELVTNGAGAFTFLTISALLAALAPWHRSLSVVSLVLVLVVWVIVERVRFPVASAWTYPTM